MKVTERDLQSIPIPLLLKIEDKELDVSCKTTMLGKFTHSKVTCEFNKRKYVGEGISRRSYKDKINDDRAYKIATGRAMKAIKKKIKGKKIHHILMA